MRGPFAKVGVAVALACAVLAAGCSCSDDDVLAELVQKEGGAERDFAASMERWEVAEVGAEFRLNDALRTSATGRAVLDLDGARLTVDPSTEIRFRREGEGDDARLDVTAGAATLEAEDEARLSTFLGVAVLEPGTRVRLSADGDGAARMRVEVGRAVLEESGGPRAIVAGEAIPMAPAPAAAPAEPRREAQAGVDVVSRGDVRQREGSRWIALEEGEGQLARGTRLRLGASGRVTVRRGDDQVELSGQGEHVVGSGGALVETVSGNARLIARESAVTVRVPGGVIVATTAEGEAEGALTVAGGAARARAVRGRVVMRRGEDEEVIDVGSEVAVAPDEDPPEEEEPAAAVVEEGDSGPADLVVRAGDDAIVHAAGSLSRIGFDLTSACPDGGLVEIGRRRAAVHGLSAGRHTYRVRCSNGRSTERGRVVVLRDSGRVALPRTPPMSIIDADGRSYTVLYQNQLPEIRVRWAGAPASGPYTLRFTQGQTERGARPSFDLASGALREGMHRFVIEAGSRRSPETRLSIRFDNAASAASVREPVDGSFGPGETVRVAGVALAGWSVAVDGRAIPLDSQHRFDAQVPAPSGRALAIRVSHPRRGTHYYLRRPRGSP